MPFALILALALQAAPGEDPQVAELHRAYEQSCLQRDYGAFDDICNQIADQIAAYERSHRTAGARPPAPPPSAPAAAPVLVPVPAPAPTTAALPGTAADAAR